MRLHVFLSRAGILSRQKNKTLVREGAVRVNGTVVTEPFHIVDPACDRVDVDDVGEVRLPEGFTYVWMNKPRGHICAFSDPEGRPTLAPYFPADMPKVHPVGRLDFNTEGAVLLTDDGELARRVLHPSHALTKTYRAKIRGHIAPDDPALEILRQGIEMDGTKTLPAEIAWEADRTRASWIRFVLREGRFRQIRRMCAHVGWQIVKLQRVAIGSIALGDLTPRTWRLLTPDEVAALAATVGLERGPAAQRRA